MVNKATCFRSWQAGR